MPQGLEEAVPVVLEETAQDQFQHGSSCQHTQISKTSQSKIQKRKS